MGEHGLSTLCRQVLDGEVAAAARLIREIDDGHPDAKAALQSLYPHSRRAKLIGITGPPGVGKSTLTSALITRIRARDQGVGVLAVDPSSPFSGGAVLGDRIRMKPHLLDPAVFIRSMASRGESGGMTWATRGAAVVMAALGLPYILIETLGVGQDGIDISRFAHTTLVVTAPGLGDQIQAIKAGIMEVGDIFVVNKSDLNGAAQTVAELENMVEERCAGSDAWRPGVVACSALGGKGLGTLWDALESHWAFLSQPTPASEAGQLEKLRQDVLEMVKKAETDRIMAALAGDSDLETGIRALAKGETDPYTLCDGLLGKLHRDD